MEKNQKLKFQDTGFVETKKLPNGDTEHVYEKLVTTHVDEDGKAIPGYPTEDGKQPKKDIPGYDFVKTVVDANGNTQHIYKKKSLQIGSNTRSVQHQIRFQHQIQYLPRPVPTPDPVPPQPVPTPDPEPNQSISRSTSEGRNSFH